MSSDTFLTQENCSRCRKKLDVRTMSWFNEDTICIECSDKETEVKRKLREKGLPDMEGCGYIPNPDNL